MRNYIAKKTLIILVMVNVVVSSSKYILSKSLNYGVDNL